MRNASTFAELKIKHNPFATRFIRPGAIPFIPAEESPTLSEVPNLFRQNHFLGQIVGPHGCGKTTLTHALENSLAEDFHSARRVTIHDARDVLATQNEFQYSAESGRRRSEQLLIIDGFERLPRIHRWVLINRSRRTGSGLLITTHKRILRVPLLCELRPSLKTLVQVAKYLAPDASIETAVLENAFEHSGGNIRESMMLLYDWFETHQS